MQFLTSQELATQWKFKKVLQKMYLTQLFGMNANSFYAAMGLKGHNGLDLRAGTGTETFAAVDGVVTAVEDNQNDSKRARGHFVYIRTDWATVYGKKVRLKLVYYHLHEVFVKVGDKVKAGQLIATTDNTGKYTTGPHLHFGVTAEYEVRPGAVVKDVSNGYNGAVDPRPFFTVRAFDGHSWIKKILAAEREADKKLKEAKEKSYDVEWAKKWAGHLLWAAEDKGQVYWVSPKTLKRYEQAYTKNWLNQQAKKMIKAGEWIPMSDKDLERIELVSVPQTQVWKVY